MLTEYELLVAHYSLTGTNSEHVVDSESKKASEMRAMVADMNIDQLLQYLEKNSS